MNTSTVGGPLKIDLTRERLCAGYTLRSLGKHLGVHPNTIKRAEAGDPIRPVHARLLADFYGRAVPDIWDLGQAA